MKAAKRESILLEAAKCFARFGFKKASVDQIAKMAGVAKGTIYNAAKNKDDLFYQVLHREVRAWIAAAAQHVDPRAPADALLMETGDQAVAYLMERPLLRTLLFGEAHALMPGWVEELDKLTRLACRSVEEILELGMEQGLFKKDLDVPVVARILLDMHLSYFLLHDRGQGQMEGPDYEHNRTAAYDLILNGLRVR